MSVNTTFPGFNASNCDPLFYDVDGSTGCTLTRADIRPFSQADFASQEMKEVGMDKVVANTKEARMVGVPQKALMDIVLSRHVAIREGAAGPRQSVIAPYRLVPRRTHVNLNYFLISAGSPTAPVDPATAFPSTLPATVYFLTVSASTGGFGSAVQNVEKYFLPGQYLHVTTTARHVGAEWTSYVGGGNIDSLVRIQFRVVAAVGKASTPGTSYIAVAPTEFQSYEASSAGWAALLANDTGSPSPLDRIHATRVTKGTLIILANSVSDRESWCYQPPAINNLGLIEYWRQTERWTHQYNDEYLKALAAPLTSDFFKKFRTLPIAEQRRQQELWRQRWFLNTVFYGSRISDKQTVATYSDLPQVDDLTNPGCTLEFKSNTLGIFTQMAECGKLTDLNGGALNIDTIRELAYYLKRERGNDGSEITTIDLMTDRFTKSRIRSILVDYNKKKSGIDSITLNANLNQKIVDSRNNKTVMEYDKFDLPDEGVSLALFTDTFFDDAIGGAASLGADAGTKNAARQIWVIDWSDINIGLHGSRSVTRQTNLADNLYNCVIDPNVNHYKLNSKTFEVQVGNVNRHAVISNFSEACPTVTVGACAIPSET